MIHCAILGFQIDRAACRASRNHPLCRECKSRGLASNESTDKIKKPLKSDSELSPLQTIKRKARKRFECRKGFIPNSNPQRFCPRCREWNETSKKWDRQTRFRKRVKTGREVTV